ncbi:MAG: metal-dependent hydrolase [Patescibacteria group bacterium]|nr:metal-dependent hydrolase [Patescibacteria group bacterium]
MLPPGHVAAGYLVAEGLLTVLKPQLSGAELNHLVWWGMFFSFAPDLDNFLAFFKIRSFYYYRKDNTIHRQFLTHVPVLWLLAGLLLYLFGPTLYVRYIGVMLWAGSWSHFILDSLDYGVMWLWPFNREVWALRGSGVKKQIDAPDFFNYWLSFLKLYTTRLTFYAEIAILAAAAVIYKLH